MLRAAQNLPKYNSRFHCYSDTISEVFFNNLTYISAIGPGSITLRKAGMQWI